MVAMRSGLGSYILMEANSSTSTFAPCRRDILTSIETARENEGKNGHIGLRWREKCTASAMGNSTMIYDAARFVYS